MSMEGAPGCAASPLQGRGHGCAQCQSEESGAVLLEAFLRGLLGVAKSGEVEVQDDVAVAVRRRPPSDVCAGKQRLEPVGRASVVVVLQQRNPARLPEPARAEEKGVAHLFQLVQEAGLVDVQGVLAAHRLEVGPAVGYLWIRSAQLHASCRVLPRYYSLKRWQASTRGRSHVGRTFGAVEEGTADEGDRGAGGVSEWRQVRPADAWQAHFWQIAVRVVTDGGGGRARLRRRRQPAVQVINDHLSRFLVGRSIDDVSDIAAAWDELYRVSTRTGAVAWRRWR